MKEIMTRKEFFQTLAVFGAAALGGGSLLSSCAKEEKPQTTTASRPKPKKKTPTTSSLDPCADVSELTQPELTMRNDTLKYVAKTPDESERCDNCQFWQVPVADAPCGGCQLIKGPIHPAGYCTSWFEKAE